MLANKQIVVVEDEIDILDLISLHLKKERFNVRGFLNGYSFMKYMETERPSLLVLDLMLPDVDGFEICKQLQGEVRLCLDAHYYHHRPLDRNRQGARPRAWRR